MPSQCCIVCAPRFVRPTDPIIWWRDCRALPASLAMHGSTFLFAEGLPSSASAAFATHGERLSCTLFFLFFRPGTYTPAFPNCFDSLSSAAWVTGGTLRVPLFSWSFFFVFQCCHRPIRPLAGLWILVLSVGRRILAVPCWTLQ